MKSQFCSVAKQGMLGALYGLVGGLVLGLVIYGVLVLSALVFASASESFIQEFPPQIILMLSMGWGAVLGAIFGGLTGLKK